MVLDAAEDMSHAAIQECSVFIVPQVLTTKPYCIQVALLKSHPWVSIINGVTFVRGPSNIAQGLLGFCFMRMK